MKVNSHEHGHHWQVIFGISHFMSAACAIDKQLKCPSKILHTNSVIASALNESGHFEVRKSSSKVNRIHFLFPKKVDQFVSVTTLPTHLKTLITFFSRRPRNTLPTPRRLFHCQNETNKPVGYYSIFFLQLFCRSIKLPSRKWNKTFQLHSILITARRELRHIANLNRATCNGCHPV